MACRNHVSSVLPLYIILFLFMFCYLFLTARACAITHDTARHGTPRHAHPGTARSDCKLWRLRHLVTTTLYRLVIFRSSLSDQTDI